MDEQVLQKPGQPSSDSDLQAREEKKTYNRNKWLFSTTGIGRDMLYCLVGTYFFQYIQFGLTLTTAQFITLNLLIGILGRIWDGINDPMMGAIIDGAKLKWGKFKPWIFWGAVLDSVLTLALFNVRPFNNSEVQGWLYVAIICFVYLIWEAAFTMNDIGYWGMIPTLSRTKKRRDEITTLTIFFAGIGSILMTALISFYSPGNMLNAFTIYSIIACVAVILGQSITAFGVKEPPREEAEQDPNNKVSMKNLFGVVKNNKQLLWMCLALLCSSVGSDVFMGFIYNLYYMEVGYDGNVFYFIVVYAVCNTVMQLLYPKIAQKWGRKKIQWVSMIVIVAGYMGLLLCGWVRILPLNLLTLIIFGIPVFVAGTWFYTATLVNMSNTIEYNEYTTGRRDEAGISAMRPLVVKFSSAIKSLVVTLVLVIAGIYGISQYISAMETQVSMFEKKVTSVEQVRQYVNDMNYYKVELDNGKAEAVVDDELAQNSLLDSCQVQAKYVEKIETLYLAKYTKDAEGNNKNLVAVKQLDELENAAEVLLFVDNDNYNYCLYIKGDGFTNNSVNELFSENKTIGKRLTLRIACTIVPALCIFFSWYIQKKKFIIDEAYFDMMIKTIDERKKEKNEEEEAEKEKNKEDFA